MGVSEPTSQRRPRAAPRGEDGLVGAKGSKAGAGGVTVKRVGLIPEVTGGRATRLPTEVILAPKQAEEGASRLVIIQAWDAGMELGRRGFPENQGWVPRPPPFAE